MAASERGYAEENPMAETLGLATSSNARPVRNAPRFSLATQEDHTDLVGRIGPVAVPPPIILAGALAKLNIFERRRRRVEPIYPSLRGQLV